MSVSEGFDFKLSQRRSAIEIINKLLSFGWTFDDDGKTTYLPLGDNDDYDWQHENIEINELIKILTQKEENGEIIGVIMTWKDTEIGGAVLFWADRSFSFNPRVNRKCIEDLELKITDVNWYLTKIIPAVTMDGLCLESISYTHHV